MSTVVYISLNKGFSGIHTFSTSLNKPRRHKSQIISRIKSMPYSTRRKRRHSASESRFLSSWRDAKIYTILEPFIGILIPCFYVFFIILGSFQSDGGDVYNTIPTKGSIWIVPVESNSRKNKCTFSHFPYAVEF